jgi:hypothetical protein
MLDVTGTARVAGVFYLGNATAGQAYFDGGYSAKIDASGVGHGQDLRFHTGSAGAVERMRITSSGNVGIETTAPDKSLTLAGYSVIGWSYNGTASYHTITAGGTNPMAFRFSPFSSNTAIYTFAGYTADPVVTIINDGTIYAKAFTQSSDRRLKNNIVNTHFGITDLMKIQVRDYVYKADASKTQVTGFIAQELYEIFPNAVSKPAKAEDMWSVDYGKVTPLLVKAVQEQQATIEAQQKQIDELKAQNNALAGELKAEIENLKKAITGSSVVVRGE